MQAVRGAEQLQLRQLGGHALSTAAFVVYTLVRLGYVGGEAEAARKEKAA